MDAIEKELVIQPIICYVKSLFYEWTKPIPHPEQIITLLH